MGLLKKVALFVAEYFVFLGGLLFIFVAGMIYAMLRVDYWLAHGIFALIVIGWIAFLVRYFWDLMEKKDQG